MQCSYIEVAVSLIEAAKMQGQGAEDEAHTALLPALKNGYKA